MRTTQSAIIGILRFIVWAALAGIAASASAYDAEVIYATGQAYVRETTKWVPLKEKQQLNAGAAVRTGAFGQVALLLRDNTQLRVNQNSELTIKGVNPDETTAVELNQGHIWAQAKRFLRAVTGAVAVARPAVQVTTPTSTIGIRGTDWDVRLDPDGATTLTVLSGVVELSNPQGSITVAPNEQARSEAGKPPSKILLTKARDRIQWVTVYRPQPQRWAGDGSPATADLVRAIEAGEYAAVFPKLEKLADRSEPAARLLADLYIAWGRATEAVTLLQGKNEPLSMALLAQALLVNDEAGRAGQLIAAGLARHPDHAELLIARGDWARFEGQGNAARQAFGAAIATAPKNAAGWFGRGRVDVEREALNEARADLQQALVLDPNGAGFRGELGTLETYANNFPTAEARFQEALDLQYGDFNALTGLGIVKLKTGKPEEALQAFLKAGVLQPDFARAALWTGVAYYRLGREQNALDTLKRAAQLDPNDPLPHFYAAMIHTDRQEPGEAVAAARQAIALWPKLRSLNQVASDQKGSANLGTTLERFGLEEWAQAAAWQAYTPFWGGSHLFLADRTPDTYGKNSELFQGFIADPLVFGADPRRNSLVSRPENVIGARLKAAAGPQRVGEAGAQWTGQTVEPFPLAWFLDAERNYARPDDEALRSDLKNLTLGLGVKPAYDTGLFLFANRYQLDLDFTDASSTYRNAPASVAPTRVDIGLHRKFSPESHFWMKLGYGSQDRSVVGPIPTPDDLASLLGGRPTVAFDYADKNAEHDLQFKQAWVSGAHSLHVALERAEGTSDYLTTFDSRTSIGNLLRFGSAERQKRSSTRLSFNDYLTLSPELQLHLQAAYTDYSQQDRQTTITNIVPQPLVPPPQTSDLDVSRLSPRIGAVWHFAVSPAPSFGRATLRAAWREWLQPAGAATLDRLDTAGLPLDTRSAKPGGLMRNGRVQLEWETPRHFYLAYLEGQRLENRSEGFVPDISAMLSELEKLRQKAPGNVSGEDLLEGTPQYGAGRLHTLGLAGNWIVTDRASLYSRLILRDSESQRENRGNELPYLPQTTFVLGGTQYLPHNWSVGAQAVHRSESFTAVDHATRLPAGWGADAFATWRSPDKQWRFSLVAKNLGRERPAPRSALAQIEAWW
jgi:tetratricopeptide (TPR) repeat protein